MARKFLERTKTRWGNDNGLYTCQHHNTQYFITRATKVRTKLEYTEYVYAGILEWFEISSLHTDTHTLRHVFTATHLDLHGSLLC